MKKPRVIKVFPSVERNPNTPLQEFKVRVIEFPDSIQGILLDIREFITSEIYMGFSVKGVSLTLAQVKHIYSMMPTIIEVMENETQRQAKVFEGTRERETIERARPDTSTKEMGDSSTDSE